MKQCWTPESRTGRECEVKVDEKKWSRYSRVKKKKSNSSNMSGSDVYRLGELLEFLIELTVNKKICLS